MNYSTESDVTKLGPVIRVLAGFILLCSLPAGFGLVFDFVTGPFDIMMPLFIAVIFPMVHISGCICFRGYAPKYLLFAHGPKKNT